jgi:hypothetical protein
MVTPRTHLGEFSTALARPRAVEADLLIDARV